MTSELKPDFERAVARHEAFWRREVIDRAPVSVTLLRADAKPVPQKQYATLEARWLDVDFRAEQMDAQIANTEYLFDALPIAFPNMGPEIFSAWCGCGYEYGETTTWSSPCIDDWEKDAPKARLDMRHPLFEATQRFMDALIERGRNRFIVGLTDLHPGGDHLAALRDPMNLNIDMIENPEWVDEMLRRAEPEFFAVYGAFYDKIRRAGMPTTSWLPLVHEGRYYIPSNDFSCMISTAMFEQHFLPGIRRECQFYDRSIYHLDGPNALRHLDLILEIPELDAVQWVFGAGNEGFARWRKVYQRIQAAGKGIWLMCDASELDDVFSSLRPEGVFFGSVGGIRGREAANALEKRIAKWK